VSCWLGNFLHFAHDSYKFIAFPIDKKIKFFVDVKDHAAAKTQYTFDFLDNTFHNIIDEVYRDHLAPVFSVLYTPDGATNIDGQIKENWLTFLADYCSQVLDRLEEWTQDLKRPKAYCSHFAVLVKRVTYILDEAYKNYPFISKLNISLSLACNTFIHNLGQDLYDHHGTYV